MLSLYVLNNNNNNEAFIIKLSIATCYKDYEQTSSSYRKNTALVALPVMIGSERLTVLNSEVIATSKRVGTPIMGGSAVHVQAYLKGPTRLQIRS